MSIATFKGGVHPEYFKELTASLAVTPVEPPKQVVIPMLQHIGAPCEPLVKPGDRVLVGEKIGESEAFVSAPVHATVSGEITAVAPHAHPSGQMIEAITIESDGEDSWEQPAAVEFDWEKLSPDEIRRRIREAGIVGLGGAAFPAHVKLAPPEDKPIDTVILNGAECEPYLTADHRLMLEQPQQIVTGLLIMLKILGAGRGIIGIEDNKADALRVMRQEIEGRPELKVASLRTCYPQGAEKMLIEVTAGRTVPAGGLPMDVGVVNHNVGTALAIARAVTEGRPLVERVVTVTGGGVARPANLLVRIGTRVGDLLELCGGMKEDTGKLIIGGPMMGLSQPHPDIPVVKGTSGITVLSDEEFELEEATACIKCAKCVDSCPVNLLPLFLAEAAEHGLIERAEKYRAADCIECGCCSYICPARRPLTQWIRLAKAEVLKRRRQR
ncbi:MAG: electron transport complex subunit RsxC [Firmicutes bacterium]|nr:electron transport complex subunit RsxC [Bacillota bacterium]